MKINKLLIATHNPGKFAESQKLLNSAGIETTSLSDLGISKDYEETGETYEENAMAKAKFYYNLAKIPTIADDSGLSVDALDGEPGVHSRTWPGYTATDEELLEMILDKMKDIPKEKRLAQFITVIALFDGQEEFMARGEQSGIITDKAESVMDKGLPYSAVFHPMGCDKVFSQLSI